MIDKLLKNSLILFVLINAGTAIAEEINTSIIEFSPNAGYYQFDSEHQIDDSPFIGMGLGLHFTRAFALILNYSRSDTKLNNKFSDGDVDVQKYHIDALYFFNVHEKLRPYVTLGYGQIDFKNYLNEEENENNINGGIGLSFQITPKWSVRADARNFHSFGDSYNDQTFMMTLGYRVGEGERGE